MKIEFGGGETPTKTDFLQQDIRDLPGIDFVCTAWEIDKLVDNNSVDEIFSRHFFEHLTFAQGEYLFEVWHRILKPGGRVEMMLPNMLLHVRQWVTGDPRAAKNIYGGQRGDFNDVWDVHKSGYDAYSMEDLVKEKNFVNYKSFNGDKSKHLHVEFYK
jgi:predicted SAM-dependent methyltransferase